MYPLLRFAGCALSLSVLFSSMPSAHAQKPLPAKPVAETAITGIYQGKIQPTPVISMTLVFHVTGTATKPATTMDVPEQGAKGYPVSKTTIQGNTVTFAIEGIGANFTGKRSADGRTIVGTFTQGGRAMPLTLTKTESEVVLVRPQTPKPPFPYRTEEVSYPNSKAGITIGGTLNVPQGAGPFPVALFITGSGAQDRDETIMGHKPFAVIADYLARHGIASLRVDDRGVGKTTGSFSKATSADFADDTRAGVAFLQTRSEIDPKHIGLIGHSEGGLIAPMVAANNPAIAFAVLLAGPGVPGKDLILEQQKAIVQTMNVPEAALAENQKISKAVIAIIESEKDPAVAKQKVKALLAQEVAVVPEAQRNQVTKQLEAGFLPWCEPWFTYFLLSDPAPTLQSLSCPVLALDGSLDLQVIAKQNLPAIEAALKKGNNPDVTVREMPGLNHLFQHAKTGSPVEYSQITETVSPEVLTLLADWITQHTAPKAP